MAPMPGLRGRRSLSGLLGDCVVAGRNLTKEADAIIGVRLIARCLPQCAQRVDFRTGL